MNKYFIVSSTSVVVEVCFVAVVCKADKQTHSKSWQSWERRAVNIVFVGSSWKFQIVAEMGIWKETTKQNNKYEMNDWPSGWLTDYLTDRPTDRPTDSLFHSLTN